MAMMSTAITAGQWACFAAMVFGAVAGVHAESQHSEHRSKAVRALHGGFADTLESQSLGDVLVGVTRDLGAMVEARASGRTWHWVFASSLVALVVLAFVRWRSAPGDAGAAPPARRSTYYAICAIIVVMLALQTRQTREAHAVNDDAAALLRISGLSIAMTKIRAIEVDPELAQQYKEMIGKRRSLGHIEAEIAKLKDEVRRLEEQKRLRELPAAQAVENQ